MHEYYRKNLRKLKKDSDKYLHFIEREIEELFQKPYESAFDEIWNYYTEEMVEHFPYIGGDDVSGTKNLTGCMFFIAIGVVGKNYGLSTHDWGRLVTTLYERKFDKMPKLIRKITANVFRRHPAIIINALKKKDKKNAENNAKNPGSFLTQTMEPSEEYPIVYHNLFCPIHVFCEKRGYMEYLPYMCNLDYVMFGALGVALYREKTCATGDGYCDFKMKRDAAPPAVWPPHILNENDPLK